MCLNKQTHVWRPSCPHNLVAVGRHCHGERLPIRANERNSRSWWVAGILNVAFWSFHAGNLSRASLRGSHAGCCRRKIHSIWSASDNQVLIKCIDRQVLGCMALQRCPQKTDEISESRGNRLLLHILWQSCCLKTDDKQQIKADEQTIESASPLINLRWNEFCDRSYIVISFPF